MKISIIILFILASFTQSRGQSQTSADVLDVKISGTKGNYVFHVTILSPDKDCEQYADWWEVVSTEGVLIYRRILAHSHVDEQPFTRSGGTVRIFTEQEVIVRAHMNNTGYGGKVMAGNVVHGFQHKALEPDFAESLEKEQPLPDGCAF